MSYAIQDLTTAQASDFTTALLKRAIPFPTASVIATSPTHLEIGEYRIYAITQAKDQMVLWRIETLSGKYIGQARLLKDAVSKVIGDLTRSRALALLNQYLEIVNVRS